MRQKKLKNQFNMLSAFIFVVSLILYVAMVLMVFKLVEDDSKVHRESMVNIAIDKIDDAVNIPLGLLNNVDYMIDNHDIEGDVVTQYLETIQISYPYFEEIHLIDKKGVIVNTAPFDKHIIGNSVKYEPYYLDTAVCTETYHWSEVYISSSSGHPTISITYCEEDYYIVTNLDLQKLPITLTIDNYFEEIYTVSILDKWGNYIISEDYEKVEERVRYGHFDQLIELSGSESWYEHREWEVGIHSLESMDWYLVFEFDLSKTYKDLWDFLLIAAAIWVSLALAVAWVLRRNFRQVDKDLDVLQDKAYKIIKGESVVYQPLKFTELEGFNKDFGKMLSVLIKREKEIKAMNNSLENLVEERTLELKKMNDSLDLKVQERTEQLVFLNHVLEGTVKEAESANEAKSRFLSIMSHEMRTPLNGILGFMQMLLETGLNEEQQDMLATIQSSSEILLGLINEVLDVEKYASGKMTFMEDECLLEEAVNQMLEPYKNLAMSKGLAFEVKLDNMHNQLVRFDSMKIRQFINNLLSNALKFTYEGSVSVYIKAIPLKKDVEVRFKVKDTGIGIKPEVKPYLFKPFSQANGEISRTFGGTGLGLAICKEIVNHYSGGIGFESVHGEGTEFYGHMYFPKANQSVEEDVNTTGTLKKKLAPKGYVLVAEDNLVNQKLMTKFLDKYQVDYLLANNGKEALELLKTNDVSIIFMDCQMPVMDGFEATRKIRESYGDTIEIIAMTAYASNEDKERCYSTGMDQFITKPIEFDHLLKILCLKEGGQATTEIKGSNEEALETEITLLMNKIQFDYETTADLMETYIDQMNKGFIEMEELLAVNDMNGLSMKAHKLKGAAGAVFIERHRQIMEDIEKLTKEEKISEVKELLHLLKNDVLFSE
jgi:signal transduction histidine kinase/FixJ family two-component response regulator